MNKIQTSIYINATSVDVENNKIMVLHGDFYFQGQKYTIENGKIKGA